MLPYCAFFGTVLQKGGIEVQKESIAVDFRLSRYSVRSSCSRVALQGKATD